MFNKAVFIQALKSNWVLLTAVAVISNILLIQFSALEALTDLLPVIFYGMMVMIIPSVYVLITSNKLLCSQVDSGSLAYTLATKVKRESIVFTQIVFLIASIFVLFLSTTLINCVTNMIIHSYSVGEIIKLNFSAFCAVSALAGICYMFSCIFNLTKINMGITGVLTVVFVLAFMLGQFAELGLDALKYFKYLTLFSLYNSGSIMAGTSTWIVGFIILLCISAATFVSGTFVFKKKDLPL